MIKINQHHAAIKTFSVLLSRIVSATISLFFVPVYIRLLGVESYGLVTFYLFLTGTMVLIDFALSTALSRQVVVLKTNNQPVSTTRNLVFSMEVIYAAIAAIIILIMMAFAKPIAQYWLKAKELPLHRLTAAVQYIGIVIALQLPVSIYNGVMTSLEKQVLNSIITIIVNVLKAAGVIAVLQLTGPTIENYFIWQIAITLLSVLILRYFTWQQIKGTESPSFSIKALSPIKIFAIGMFGVTIVNFLLSMVDKIAVSKMVVLNLVACYSLAFQIASVLGQIITPLQPVIFPKFTALLVKESFEECVRLYHKACRWVALIIWPLGLFVVFFAEEILIAWAKNEFVTSNTAPVLRIVAIGTICNSLMFVPYVYMLSKGKTKFTIVQNLIGSLIFLPMLFWSIPKYGILGASFMWLGINVSYILISLPLFHKLYMKNELLNWYLKDNLAPFVLSLALVVIAKMARLHVGVFASDIYFIVLGCLLGGIYIFAMPELRKMALKMLKLKL